MPMSSPSAPGWWASGLADEIVTLFLATPFDGGRHARRVGQITALEADF